METKATDSTAVIRDHTTSSTIDVLSASLRRSSLPQFQLIPRWSHIGDRYEETISGHRNIVDRNTDVDHHQDIDNDSETCLRVLAAAC
ncbi:hypothetical protein FNV43_RR26432 [Rhamnella rubrinervis]|uniref:Uncharacterized protein n=1 Tax=Rhamnella rubrinervis TaxID=2594499 RepID=A0A8K0DPU4_9ROSA|nr:hypothetical protein FNV43_RR26432 [Rhamnella rubrinervis]